MADTHDDHSAQNSQLPSADMSMMGSGNPPAGDDGIALPPPVDPAGYAPDPTPASDPKYKNIARSEEKEANAVFYRLASIHPFAEFHEATFIDLLEHSLSLPTDEKKAVVDAIPRLSQFQVDELIKVFVDEREEFKKIFNEDKDLIMRRIEDIRREWEQLKDIYVTQEMERSKKDADQGELARLQAMLSSESNAH